MLDYQAFLDALDGRPFHAAFSFPRFFSVFYFALPLKLANVVYEGAPLRAWSVRCIFLIQFSSFISLPPGYVYKDETSMASPDSWPGLASLFIALELLVGWYRKE
jgi:hypothetical protein